ncbi:MAG TPA: formate--tetrahydrofolate ligase [Gaiellaceae bacterium]|nr:formate--tetrahydrofolate ligase [Gaiellaceae bacterium]
MTTIEDTHATSLRIAQEADPRPIAEIAAGLGLADDEIELYGRFKAKVGLDAIERRADTPDGALVCVTAITPTKAGEGKTTTAIALTEALGLLGERAALCLREPSMGPVFGIKGGGAGAGRAQVVPMEDLNLHFTGDLHAIAAANNLLAAMVDAHLLHGNELGIDPLSITFRRCLDTNDRALRDVVVALGGRANGYPRETGFDITAASEVMALLAVARDLPDLRRRLGDITVAHTFDGDRVTAEQLGVAGSMAVLLKDAIKPNLIQTLEGQPVFVHCGPFANIAHGNNSLVADRLALKLADFVVTESGFGADMGLEKFAHIVAPLGGLRPSAVVLVATVRALRENGEDNLGRHVAIIRELGHEPIVAVNRFGGDTRTDVAAVRRLALDVGALAAEVSDGFERGGQGAAALAEAVYEAAQAGPRLTPLYSSEDALRQKIEAVATRVYGAGAVVFSARAQAAAEQLTRDGLAGLPVCLAKTPLSLSHDPGLGASPKGFALPIADLRPYTGAGWIVALCGDTMTMPGLGRSPAALAIDIDADGRTVGLF